MAARGDGPRDVWRQRTIGRTKLHKKHDISNLSVNHASSFSNLPAMSVFVLSAMSVIYTGVIYTSNVSNESVLVI